MELDPKGQQNQGASAGVLVDPFMNAPAAVSNSKGSSILDSQLNQALDQNLAVTPTLAKNAGRNGAPGRGGVAFDEAGDRIDSHSHDHGPGKPNVSRNREVHVSFNKLKGGRGFDSETIEHTSSAKLLARAVATKGDLIDTGAGAQDVAIGGKGSDVFAGDQGGINIFTTGTGQDTVILGKETTNRVFDFDAKQDRLALTNGLTANDVTIVQGTNKGKGGVNQPLDSVNNALVVSKADGHILASLTFAKATDLSAANFRTVSDKELALFRKVENVPGFSLMKGDGTISSDQNSNNIKTGGGNDFVRLGGNQVKFNTIAINSGQDEFPFPNTSPGKSQINIELNGGRLSLKGNYDNFDGAPLFSQGEDKIDPNATILNGSDPVALINGFLATPQDSEGNKITGTHIHFSPSGDDRGNFADATIIRYISNNVANAKAGTIAGGFNLKPEEEAALIGGDLYFNLHTNIDLDKDGKAGFPTGENRGNANKNIVQFV
jgi:hypothetical protein